MHGPLTPQLFGGSKGTLFGQKVPLLSTASAEATKRQHTFSVCDDCLILVQTATRSQHV